MELADKYLIIEQLGKKKNRKFGEIYLGKNRSSHEKVVIKAVRKKIHPESAIERLRHEALFSFNFIGLPQILDLFESENEIVLVRRHVEGEPIHLITDRLRTKKRLSFVIQFLESFKRIYDHLEQNNIVHADIKPGNILIENRDNEIGVQLIDFGMAFQLNQPEERTTLFPLGYAAPELLLNQLDIVNHQTDQFALGVMIWRLFCEEIPLTHPNPSIMTNLQLTHPLPDHPNLPKGVYRILLKMCNKHQFRIPPNKMNEEHVKEHLIQAMNDRFASINDVLTAFKSIPERRFFYQKRSLR